METPPNEGPGPSIDGTRVPFTIQADARRLSIEEAYSAGLFEPISDEPGMIRMPISLELFLPYEALHPPASPPRASDACGSNQVPTHAGSGRSHARFGNYPRAIAARNIARGLQDVPGMSAREQKTAFRDLLGVMPNPGHAATRRAAGDAAPAEDRPPAGTPIRLVADEEEVRRGAGGRELSPIEGLRQEAPC